MGVTNGEVELSNGISKLGKLYQVRGSTRHDPRTTLTLTRLISVVYALQPLSVDLLLRAKDHCTH